MNRNLIIGGGLFIAISVAIIALLNSINLESTATDRSARVDLLFSKSAQQIADLGKVVADGQETVNDDFAAQNNRLVTLESGAQVAANDLALLKEFGIEYFPAVEKTDSTGEVVGHRWLATCEDSTGQTVYMYAGKEIPDSAVVMIPQNRIEWNQKTANRSLYLGFRLMGYSAKQADSLYKAVLVKFDTKVIENALANAPGMATQTAAVDSQTTQTIAALQQTVSDLTTRMNQLEDSWTKRKKVQNQYNRIIKEEHKSKHAKYFTTAKK